MSLAPIVLFVYNRPWHTKQTIGALQQNELADDSELFIYSDAPRNEIDAESVVEVRKLIKSVSVFKKVTIIERNKNWGLANSIIDGVTTQINTFGKVIVLEDDLITSSCFLKFMNQALDFYQNEERIYSITGFSFSSKFMQFPDSFKADVYSNIRPMSWSWATWKREWDGIDWNIRDFDEFISSRKKTTEFNKGGTDLAGMLKAQKNGDLDSWYIRWCYNSFLNGKYTIYPKVSFVNNIGHDNTGVHCGVDSKNIYSHTELNVDSNFEFENNITPNKLIVSKFNKAFNPSLLSKIKKQVKNILKYAKIS